MQCMQLVNMTSRITKEILLEAIANRIGEKKEDIDILDSQIADGSKKGDGYACYVASIKCQVKVKGQAGKQEVKFIAKLPPANQAQQDILETGGLFEIECLMYESIIPAMREYQGKLSVPLSFYQSNANGVIIMEDLREEDYFMVDKMKGLDMDEVKLVLEQLAFFHTSSYHFLNSYPHGGKEGFTRDFKLLNRNTMMKGDSNDFEPLFETQDAVFDEVLEEVIGKTDPDLVQRSREFTKIRKQVNDSRFAKAGKFMAIYHSDSWYNNFMFRKSQGPSTQTDGLKLLDLQLCRVARPAMDIAYFFGSSTRPAFRKEHFKTLLEYYFGIFSKELKSFGYKEDIYTFTDFLDDVRDCWPFAFSMAKMHTLNIFTPADSSAALDLSKMDEGGMEKLMLEFRAKQIELAKKNEDICDIFVQLAKEALLMGAI